jgi:hypothetical protein
MMIALCPVGFKQPGDSFGTVCHLAILQVESSAALFRFALATLPGISRVLLATSKELGMSEMGMAGLFARVAVNRELGVSLWEATHEVVLPPLAIRRAKVGAGFTRTSPRKEGGFACMLIHLHVLACELRWRTMMTCCQSWSMQMRGDHQSITAGVPVQMQRHDRADVGCCSVHVPT